MKLENAAAFTEECINAEPAPCAHACPFQLDVRALMEKVAKGRWNAAYKALRNAVVFPTVVSVLCPAPCESDCLRTQTGDEPISIKEIESACVRFAKSRKPDKYVIPPKSERIAIIGAGVAGLSAALNLAQKNYKVTLFEKADAWGGELREHARFDEFDADLTMQFTAADVEFAYNTEISSLDELSDYDMIYIATGAGGDCFGLHSRWPGNDTKTNVMATSEAKVYMGGAVTGASFVDSIVQGKTFSKIAEVFLQTGKADEATGAARDAVCRVDVSSALPSPRIIPAGTSGYDESEAKSEAARCLLCDCEMCLMSCEMLDAFRKKPKKIAMEVYTDYNAIPPYSTHTLTRQTYSCLMCGHCKDICPNDIDIGALLQYSRTARIELGEYPSAFHDYWLREMDFSTGEASFLALPQSGTEYIFFPGCQLGAHNPEYVLKSYEFLLKHYKAGIYVNCCGAPAYWAGDNERLNSNLDRIRDVWRERSGLRFVFACATCESMFDMFLPEIPRVSLYELLADSGDVAPMKVYENASVFDPCNSRKNRDMERSVRDIAMKSGAAIIELAEKNRCCGYGGHIQLANPSLYGKMISNRVSMGENPYIVYCVNCREVFLENGKDCAHILDLAFGIPRSVAVPSIDSKRENAMEVKKIMCKEFMGVDIAINSHEWDAVELIVGEELAENVNRKLIALSDIKEAIWYAEASDDYFVDEADGVRHCNMKKPPLTYWVQYRNMESGAYEVYGAYYHRMMIND